MRLISVGLALLLVGCVTHGPGNNARFGWIWKIDELEGVYKNLGEGAPHTSPVYLADVIWPNGGLEHVETIEVRKVAPDTLKVRAVTKGVVEKESLFVEGKDFSLVAGRIKLKASAGMAGLRSGEPLVGPTYESAELGLDKSGQGKYRESSAVAGLVFLILPMAFGENRDVKFARLKE